jgi:hypothetical protein
MSWLVIYIWKRHGLNDGLEGMGFNGGLEPCTSTINGIDMLKEVKVKIIYILCQEH